MDCSVSSCDKPVQARGWCKHHYYRWHTYGDPERAPALRPCGTTAAYRRHRSLDEEPCDACVEAQRADARSKYAGMSPDRKRAIAVAAIKRQRIRREVEREELAPGTMAERSCSVCLVAYSPSRPNQTYCNAACRNIALQARKRTRYNGAPDISGWCTAEATSPLAHAGKRRRVKYMPTVAGGLLVYCACGVMTEALQPITFRRCIGCSVSFHLTETVEVLVEQAA